MKPIMVLCGFIVTIAVGWPFYVAGFCFQILFRATQNGRAAFDRLLEWAVSI